MQSAESHITNKLLRLTLLNALCLFFVSCHSDGTAQTNRKKTNRNTVNANLQLVPYFGNIPVENTAVTTINNINTVVHVFSDRTFALRNTAPSPAVDGAAYTGSPSLFRQYLHHFNINRNPENHTSYPVVLTINANSCLDEIPCGTDLTELIGRTATGSSPVAAVRAQYSHFGFSGFSEYRFNRLNNASPLSVELSFRIKELNM